MRTGPAAKVLALAGTEVRLMLRNRAVAVISILLPLLLGVFWASSLNAGGDPAVQAAVVSLQLAVVLAMGIYVTATHTLVARRHAKVLKRMRTSGLTDTGLLSATMAPAVALGIVQITMFVLINQLSGAPWPTDPVPLVLAAIGGIMLVVVGALATAVVTPSPERTQITTLPLTFVVLGASVVASIIPFVGWWSALVLLPGGALGHLAQLAFSGGAWSAGLGGLPAVLPAVVMLVVWPAVFAWFAKKRFRWDPRY